MMSKLWVVLFVALNSFHLGCGSPVRPTPQTYPHDGNNPTQSWGGQSGVYAALPALALVVAGVGLLLGCTWCYRQKGRKPNEGTDNQIFTASASHLQESRHVHPPDSGFSEPVNNNITEDNNNGPISLREMQNIANNNATAYIVSENEERNRISRESVVEFEPLPTGFRIIDPLERCADWFGDDDFPRNHLQYLREIGRGWFGRVVEGEIEDSGSSSACAVKILNQNASLEDKARFLDEGRMYRDVRHENVLAFIAKCLQEDPWILIFEFCSMDLQQYLIMNRPKMAILNESGVPLRLMCDITAALAHLHSRGYLYGNLWSGGVLVRGDADNARAVLGRYTLTEPQHEQTAPETKRHPPVYTGSSEVWSLGTVIWEVCAWGSTPSRHPPPLPELPCPYRNHLYQVMQLCWNQNPESRPTSAQVQALINHLYITHTEATEPSQDDGYGSSDFEERWQRLKPNSIPKVDEHIAIIHAPSTSMTSHFTGSDQDLDNIRTIHDTLSVDMDTAVSRSSSIMSDKDPLSVQIKSDSLTNLHGSLEDVRNIYLTHNEMAVLECHQGNMILEENREKEQDKSDSSVDPWVKDIMAGSQDDVSYYKDVSDVIKNLDNILNSEKTSSSESSHQASPSRDNLTLDCKKDYPMQSSLVKSPGITNFQSILDTGFESKPKESEPCVEDDTDHNTIGTLSHSFERHSDTISQQTLENLTPDTPMKDIDIIPDIEDDTIETVTVPNKIAVREVESNHQNTELKKEYSIAASNSNVPKLKELCIASVSSVSINVEHSMRKDCRTPCDSILTERTDISEENKSINHVENSNEVVKESNSIVEVILPNFIVQNKSNTEHIDMHPIVNEQAIPQEVSRSEQLNSLELNSITSFAESISSYGPNESDFSDLIESNTCGTRIEPLEFSSYDFIEVEKLERQKEVNNESLIEAPELIRNSHKQKYIENNTFRTDKVPENNIYENIKSSVIKSEIIERKVSLDLPEISDPKHIYKDDDSNSSQPINPHANFENMSTSSKIDHTTESVPTVIEEKYNLTSSNRSSDSTNSQNSMIHKELADNNIINSNNTKFEQELISENNFELEHKTNKEISDLWLKTEIEQIQIQDPIKDFRNKEFMHDIDNEMGIKHVDDVFTFLQDESAPNSDSETIGEINKSSRTEAENYEINQEKLSKNIINNQQSNPEINSKINVSEILSDNDPPTKLESKDLTDMFDMVSVDNILNVNECSNDALLKFDTEHQSGFTTSNFKCELLLDNADIHKVHTNIKSIEMDEQLNDITTPNLKEKSHSHIDSTDSKDLIDVEELETHANDSTAYMDFYNVNSETIRNDTIDDNVKEVIQSCMNSSPIECISLINNESTVYLQLPNVGILKEVDDFLHMERIDSSKFQDKVLIFSTPITSDCSTENILENSLIEHETENVSETEVPDIEPGVTCTKLDQTFVPESMSPFESPTKSHHTDTFDENSSVVLGPFENCSLEVFKGFKTAEFVDFPKEELLAFSSNFSEMNLETPSPLRDGNFLNEVPDIAHENFIFDDIATISETIPEKLELQCSEKEVKAEQSEPQTETNTDESVQSVTEKRVSPSTPPNSPGVLDVSALQQKYLVDIDLNSPSDNCQPLNNLQNEISLNQIELQITSKLAIAENENNLNIEYSGPLSLEDAGFNRGEAMPELYLAGNGGSVQEIREGLTLDEECVQALRNELELKLPLAQVAAIEPQCENEWSMELPPPPELIVSYPGALSPIAEETGQQLCAYENDANWNASTRTDSSESYPEPCNNSTDEATDIPTGVHSEPRSDLRSDAPSGPRSEGHNEPRSDQRSEAQSDTRSDLLSEPQSKPPSDIRSEGHSDARSKRDDDVQSDHRTESQNDKCSDLLSEPHSDIRSETHSDPQSERCADNRSEPSDHEHVETPSDELSNPHSKDHSEPHEHSTYTVRSREHSPHTYTIHKDLGSSKEMTMSADSLNAIPFKQIKDDTRLHTNDTTNNKNEDEKELSGERISQVSPFLLSPSTDTSVPENSDNYDNATGVSTLSRTTHPADAKFSKPTECHSKATSIDSWCSNDTLYNVEENFDDLAMDPDLPIDFVKEKDEGNSESTDTLTHNDEKELSHCSTYIIHDSKSEICRTFSPDSITANDNYTYTKIKTEPTGTTPSIITKSDINDSTKNSQTKDLAYGTLMSGVPSYSNCTTEVASKMDDLWKIPHPELVRRSPINNIDVTPPKIMEHTELEDSGPELISVPRIKKIDSIEIACLQDSFADSQNKSDRSEKHNISVKINDSPNDHYKSDMAPSVTSTPFVDLDSDLDNIEPIPMKLPECTMESSECSSDIPNFDIFQQSVEVRPQDLTSNNDVGQKENEMLHDGESKTLTIDSHKDSLTVSDQTRNYLNFECSAMIKPQDSRDKSSQIDSGVNSEEFRQIDNLLKNRSQELSPIINASSLLLKSERMSSGSGLAMNSTCNDAMIQFESEVNEPMQSLDLSPPNNTYLIESRNLDNAREPNNAYIINFDVDDEMEQPHSIIITEAPLNVLKDNSNLTFNSQNEPIIKDLNHSHDSHINSHTIDSHSESIEPRVNGEVNLDTHNNSKFEITENEIDTLPPIVSNIEGSQKLTAKKESYKISEDIPANGKSANYATVNFLSETFEELIESNVDDGDIKDNKVDQDTGINLALVDEVVNRNSVNILPETSKLNVSEEKQPDIKSNDISTMGDDKLSSVTDNFLQNEKKFCQLDSYFPLLSDIRFTGPGTEIMSTSFTQESPTEAMSPECEQDKKPNTVGVIIKEWDSDSDSSNSSSGEFIWKQRDGNSQSGGGERDERRSEGRERGEGLSEGSGAESGSGSGSEGDEVEFVPSSWDCRAAPSKSSLRSLEQTPPDNKKRVVFKRQKYHCVYEYPREALDSDAHSPSPYLPDFSTYSDWDPSSAEEAELGYGQLFGGPSPLDLYPLRSGIAFGSDYDEDFFISSSARPFESLGVMSTTSQFFPGMHVKPALLERDLSDDITEEFPPPPSPLPTTLVQTRTPSLDFTTPDSGVEDITPGSTTDEDYKTKKLPESEIAWRTVDSPSSSESVSPSSPGGEALGGLRHTRDKLKLDLPPSPHIPSPRHNRVFNFVLDKPKRRSQETPTEVANTGNTPLVMTDETPIVTTSLPLLKTSEDLPLPEPTFSTFGKSLQKVESEQKIILTDDVEDKEVQEESPKVVEGVKGEGTVLDSGDEDSGIESSSKATLERNKTSNVS